MPTIEEFMNQYGSGAQKQQPEQQPVQQTEPTSEQQPRRTIADFMNQYGGETYRQNPYKPASAIVAQPVEQPVRIGQLQFPAIPKTGSQQAPQQLKQAPRTRQDYLKELHDLEEQAGYITDAEQGLQNAARRREITNALEEMDRREGNDPRYYDEATRAKGVLDSWANRTKGSYLGAFATLGQIGEYDDGRSPLADSPYAKQTASQYKTNKEMLEHADKLLGKGEEAMAKVQNGASFADRLLADAATGALDLGADAVVNSILPGSGLAMMGVRSFGQGAYDLRKQGGSVGKQILSGAKTATIEILTEKIGGPFEKVYGKSLTGKAVNGFIDRISRSPIVRNGLALASGFLSEGSEEVLSDILNPVADRLLKLDDGTGKIFKDGWFSDTLYDGLIGGLLGMAGESVNIGAGREATQQQREAVKASAQREAVAAVDRAIAEREQAQGNAPAAEGSQEAAESPLPQGDIPAPAEGAEAPTAQSQEFNLQQGGNISEPSQLNIDNTAEQGYNISIKDGTEGVSNDQRGSAEEAGSVPGGSVEGSGEQGRRSGGNSGLAGVVLLNQKNADKIRSRKKPDGSGGVVVELHDGSADTAAFCSFLDAAKAADPKNGWVVDAKTVEQLAKDGARVYINDEGSAGFAVNADGDIVAVFSNKAAGAPKGTTESMIPQALAAGGTKLDCFGPVLAKIYAQHGFVPVARVRFDADYARENIPGWDPSKGEPPIYFMMHNGDTVDTVVDNYGKYHVPTVEELDALPEMDYDDAYQFRDELLAKQQAGKNGDGGNGGETGLAARENNAPQEWIATENASPRNDSGLQPGMKRSQTESHTLQHMADVTGGQQEELYYVPKTERESLTNAMNRVRSDMNGEMQKLMNKEMWNGEDIDTGLSIMGLLQMDGVRTGDFSAAQAWSRIVQARGTESGRALQAFSKWTRSGVAAATQSMNALTEAKNLTEEQKTQITNDVYKFAQEYDGIEDGDLKSIRDLIKKQAKYRNTWTFGKKGFGRYLNEITDFDWLKEYAMRQMMNISADFTEEADLGQKAKTWQVNAQLSRLGTFFRNIGGNGVFGVQDTLSQDFFGVALDALIGQKTGKRTVAADKGWLSSDARKGARQGLVRSLLEVAGDVDMGEGGSKYGQGANRTFKMTGNAFDRMMSRWEQLLGYSLTSSDRTFRGAIEAEQLRGLENLENLTDEERQALAENMADYRLFQNHGLAYRISKGAHDVMNVAGFGGQMGQTGRQGGFGLGDMVMPYPGVPANLWAKALEYSPANVVKGTAEMVKLLRDVKNGKSWSVTQQQNAVMDVARGLHGTALIVGLAALFRAGIFKNADDEEDPDAKALAAAEGRQGVQINLSAALRWAQGGSKEWQKGDELMKIDWLEPMNAFLAIASLAADDLDNPGAYMLNTMEGSAQALMDMPVMTSLANIMDSYNYSKADTTGGKLAETAVNFGVDSLTGMLPAPLSQAARAMDPYYRETSGDTAAETALNRVMNAIPGLRQMLDPKWDNFGRPKENPESAYDRWMNSFVRPGQIGEYKAGEMEQALDALAERTGDPDVYPDRKSPNSFTIDGEKVQMNSSQKQFYQAVYGQTCEKYYSSVLNGKDYADLSDAEKSWLLEEVRTYAKYKAQRAVAGGMGRNDYENKQGRNLDDVLRSGVDLPGYLLGQKNANKDGEGVLKGTEVFDWLWNSDYTEKQQSAIWNANRGSSNKSWADYKATNPVAILADFGIQGRQAQRVASAIDPEWTSVASFSQEELWNYYKAHPEQEEAIAALWDAKDGKTSWADYRRKHG